MTAAPVNAVALVLRRITTLAAVLAPSRTERLLSLIAGPHASDASAHAAELARRPRHERLAAFASTWDRTTSGGTHVGGSLPEVLFHRLLRDAGRLP